MSDSEVSNDDEEVYMESCNNFDKDSDNEQDLKAGFGKSRAQNYKDEDDNDDEDDSEDDYIKGARGAEALEDEDEKDIVYDINSPEYIKYKTKHLGSKKPLCRIGSDEFYYIKTTKELEQLCKLKHYGSNLPIVPKHITKIEETIENNSSVILPIVVIEYTDFETDYYDKLLAIFDGHHRIQSYKNRLKQDSAFKLLLKIQLIKSDHPESVKTRGLFRELNSVKGFSIDIKSTKFADELCDEINSKFNVEIGKFKFDLIKDQKKVYRPSIAKEDIYSVILLTLAHLQKHNNINSTDIQIKNIIKKCNELNLEFTKKPIDWFYTDKIFGKKQKISPEMFEKATKAKCFLGLVDLKVLIEKCIEC